MLNNSFEKSDLKIFNSFYINQICSKDAKGIERIISKNNIHANTTLIIPINRNNMHWYFIKVQDGIVYIYDSVQAHYSTIPEQFKDYLKNYHNAVEPYQRVTDFPLQSSTNDCGLFMLMGIKSVMCGYPTWSFNQHDIDYLRIMITSELMQCSLTKRRLHITPEL
jgi:Ulp1 family protease